MNYAELASKGRYGDSMLVHMSPAEVGGLQALARVHGTSMTINPETGLPEAFSLGSILPMLGGAALSVVAPQFSPLTIGLITGGIGALATGDLKEGLMMGLGGMGGANLAGTFANLAKPAAQATQQAASAAMSGAPSYSPLGTLTSAGLNTPQSAAQLMPLGDVAQSLGGQAVQSAGPGAASLYTPQALGAAPNAGANFLAQSPSLSLMDRMKQAASDNKLALAGAALPLLASADKPAEAPAASPPYIRPYGLDIENVSGQEMYTPGSTEEREMLRYNFMPQPIYRAAQGGIVALAEGGDASGDMSGMPGDMSVSPAAADVYRSISTVQGLAGLPRINVEGLPVREPTSISPSVPRIPVAPPAISPIDSAERLYDIYQPRPEDAPSYNPPPPPPTPVNRNNRGNNYWDVGRYGWTGGGNRSNAYQAGGEVNEPRMLSGGGDGMSDSIPAMIGDDQPARLADGEFVIPADVVSHLGNGSSKAGAQRLYEMMDRVRAARTGKKSQAPAVDMRKMMPA